MKSVTDYIKKNEGFSSIPYLDTRGIWTVGYGHNMERGLPVQMLEGLLDTDIRTAIREVITVIRNFRELTEARQRCLTDMCFHMGLPSFKSFKLMIEAVHDERWKDAAYQILDSSYGRSDVHRRAKENAKMMRVG